MTDSNPYEAPKSETANQALSTLELKQVASAQKLIIYSIVLNIITIPMQGALFLFSIVLGFVALGMAAVGLIRLAAALQYSPLRKGLVLVAMIVPIVNILDLLVVNFAASKILIAAGYDVGLLGAKARPEQFEN